MAVAMSEEFINAEDIAELLNVSYDTIVRLLREKKMPGYKIRGAWRVKRTDFENWLEDQKNIKPEDKK